MRRLIDVAAAALLFAVCAWGMVGFELRMARYYADDSPVHYAQAFAAPDRYASDVTIGVPTIVGAIRLPQRVNWQYAMELLLTGERIDAARAKEIGLVGWVVAHDDLMAEARSLAARLCNAAPLAARATKEVAVRSAHLSTVEAIRFGETMRRVAAATEDAAEGGAAQREGRAPEWRGR